MYFDCLVYTNEYNWQFESICILMNALIIGDEHCVGLEYVLDDIFQKEDITWYNKSAPGMGNEYIYTTLLRYITRTNKDKIGLVIPAWTQNQRKDYQVKGYWQNQRVDPDGDVNTSSSDLRFKLIKAKCKASVPLLHATAYFLPVISVRDFSKNSTFCS